MAVRARPTGPVSGQDTCVVDEDVHAVVVPENGLAESANLGERCEVGLVEARGALTTRLDLLHDLEAPLPVPTVDDDVRAC